MNNLLVKYERLDISSSSEEEGEIKRASAPLPRNSQINPRIIFEISQSSAEATADEQESFELSLESLESDCNKLKLSESYICFESVKSDQYPCFVSTEEISDSPESSDGSQNLVIFVEEGHAAPEDKSVTSSKILE